MNAMPPGAPLWLSMCSGCTAIYALGHEPRGCEMPGDNGFACARCAGARPPTVVAAGRSYWLTDGEPRARWAVLSISHGTARIRRLGFPGSPVLAAPVTALSAVPP